MADIAAKTFMLTDYAGDTLDFQEIQLPREIPGDPRYLEISWWSGSVNLTVQQEEQLLAWLQQRAEARKVVRHE
jgi:hypothetical protein